MSNSLENRAVVRLKPKVDAKPIRHGMPWVYADQIVMDRRTRKIEQGELVVIEDANRAALGVFAFSPSSKIVARKLSDDAEAKIDENWFAERIAEAHRLRQMHYSEPFYRLVHAEGDYLPGVVVDRFGEVLVLQPNAAWIDARLEEFSAALLAVTGAKAVYKNARGRARVLEGLDDQSSWIAGQAPDAANISVPMNGAIYVADLSEGQKTGLFFDQRENHAFASRFAKDARALDVFSHVGGFGLAALANAASHVISVDGSEAALKLAKAGADAMGMAAKHETMHGDAFGVMERLSEDGVIFELVVADPPAFAPNKKAIGNGLRAYERVALMAARLVSPGGVLGLCSCSGAVDMQKFRAASIRGIGRAGRKASLIHTGAAGPDHPVHPQLPESSYLKSLFFRVL